MVLIKNISLQKGTFIWLTFLGGIPEFFFRPVKARTVYVHKNKYGHEQFSFYGGALISLGAFGHTFCALTYMNSIRDSDDFKHFFMLDRMEIRDEHDEGEFICLAGERRKVSAREIW